MKTTLTLLLLVVFASFLLTPSAFAQDKSGGNEPFSYSQSANNDGNTIGPMTNGSGFTDEQMNAAKQNLLNQLRTERLNNNLTAAKNLQDRLVEMSGISTFEMNQPNDPSKTGILYTECSGNTPAPFTNEGDLQLSTVAAGGYWACATATSHRSPAIFAAATFYVNGGGDEIRSYISYNGGATWTLKNSFTGFASTVDLRAGELDIEPVISGSDTLLFVCAGYNFNNHALVLYGRVNMAAGSSSYTFWGFGGALDANVNTYNPKITSDNTNYTGATYVYLMVSADSANGVRFATRFAINTSIATNTFTVRLPNAGGVSFWWQSNGQTLAYLHQDLCYFSTGGADRIYTVYNHSNAGTNQSIYVSWSNDYGVTNGGNFVLAETANVLSVICAANGGTATNVLIGYRRLFSGADYDYRVQQSSTSGTSGSFTANYIEFTSDTTLLISMQGVDLAAGVFWTGHARNGGEHFYRGLRTNTLGVTSFVSNVGVGDVSFGGCRAGYWASSNADSCVVVWSGSGGNPVYCSRLICSTVGVQGNGNEIPNVYSLSQNYPNPFNPTTNIKFAIPNSGLVKLVVYDIMGREVTTLVNEVLNAGNYTADFDASSLSSGVYFYSITAGNFTDTKKMMLVK